MTLNLAHIPKNVYPYLRVSKLCLGRPCWHSMTQCGPPLSIVFPCTSGFVAHSNSLKGTFCQFRDYRHLSRCAWNIHERFWPNPRRINLTIGMHLSGTKMTFLIHRLLSSNSNYGVGFSKQ